MPWKYLDRELMGFLDQETFTDVMTGDRHEVDRSRYVQSEYASPDFIGFVEYLVEQLSEAELLDDAANLLLPFLVGISKDRSKITPTLVTAPLAMARPSQNSSHNLHF